MAEEQRDAPLSERLDSLFRTSRPEGRNWTNDEVAARIKESHPGMRVSGAYLSALRTGRRVRPSPELQAALAEFFGVSPAYFVDPGYAESVNSQLAVLSAMNQAGVRAFALRAVGLPQESLHSIATVLDQIRKLQGLPPVEDD
ncbi:helix-turn-helix domain-containing protein [Streptomyces sp. NBC_00690]|uniref:helix-turn-helix domain-containing protein n=1 Tax=Streptomyces sp. NBC_00690 TaxID=2975808 RepID=UPI002E2E7D0D|nr:helix-turn-helix transcriptional regulator [Streptomyces sp. NBC_00690]